MSDFKCLITYVILTSVVYVPSFANQQTYPLLEQAPFQLHRGNKHESNKTLLDWYPPDQTPVNDLGAVINGTGVFGFVFNTSSPSASIPYGTYNWCNMPHVRATEYPKASDEYKLEYVEVIHRHHKRTPYAVNSFPHESYPWDCDDESLFFYGAPEPDDHAAAINWQVYTSSVNPLETTGFNGSCRFPQISAGGLLDSRQHGKDIYSVYHDLLGFLPDDLDRSRMSFRVTNNQITSQVAAQVIYGMYPASNHQRTPVLVQPSEVDSLEPGYTCSAASNLFSLLSTGGSNPTWLAHLKAEESIKLFARLDAVSGVDPDEYDWHKWWDHYFDNLSARTCHGKLLPCNIQNSSLCVTVEDANAVFRRGEYEYSFIYRDTAALFQASIGSYGIWLGELAANLRNVMVGQDKIIYRHNFSHDGAIARLLSILQVNVMMWPGMGSEVIFELYSKDNAWYLRVLWSGQILVSSNPYLGKIDMLPVDVFLAYIDGLVGVGASKLPHMCST